MRDEFISCSDDGLVKCKSLVLSGLEIIFFLYWCSFVHTSEH